MNCVTNSCLHRTQAEILKKTFVHMSNGTWQRAIFPFVKDSDAEHMHIIILKGLPGRGRLYFNISPVFYVKDKIFKMVFTKSTISSGALHGQKLQRAKNEECSHPYA
jgi:hypothetical protein